MKNSAIFAALVINSFICAKHKSAPVLFSVIEVASKKLPKVKQDTITKSGSTYFAMSEQHFLL